MSGKVVPLQFGGGDKDKEYLLSSAESHPAGKGVSEERRALLEAQKWAKRIDIAREAYDNALRECRRLGLSNTVIARAVGKSEGAIRMHFDRRGSK